MASLVPEDSESLLRDAFGTLDLITVERDRVDALLSLGPFLPRAFCAQTLNSLQAFQDMLSRCTLLASMVSVLGAAECAAHLENSAKEAALIPDDSRRAQALLHLLPHLSGVTRARAALGSYEAIRRSSPDDERVAMFAKLLDQVETLDPNDVAALAGEADEEDRAASVARTLSFNEILALAMDTAFRIEGDADRLCKMAPLFRHLTQEQLRRIYPDLGEAIRSILPGSEAAILDATPMLSVAEHDQLLRTAFDRLVSDPLVSGSAMDSLIALAPQLPASINRRQVLSVSLSLSVGLKRPELLRLLASLLTAVAREEGTTGLREISRAVRETAAWFD
jgi:hypothetical protein